MFKLIPVGDMADEILKAHKGGYTYTPRYNGSFRENHRLSLFIKTQRFLAVYDKMRAHYETVGIQAVCAGIYSREEINRAPFNEEIDERIITLCAIANRCKTKKELDDFFDQFGEGDEDAVMTEIIEEIYGRLSRFISHDFDYYKDDIIDEYSIDKFHQDVIYKPLALLSNFIDKLLDVGIYPGEINETVFVSFVLDEIMDSSWFYELDSGRVELV